MRRLVYFLGICCSVFFYSCEEEFDPKSQFIERYSLNLIIQSDTTTHVAVLKRSYNVDGYDPYQNEIDPAVLGADIRLWNGDEVYVFRDSIRQREDTSRYNTPVHFYYLKDFSPEPGEELEIKAQLNNGKTLTARTRVPLNIEIVYGSDVIIPSQTDYSAITWTSLESGLYYVSRLKMFYRKKEGERTFFIKKDIPLDYKDMNGESVPVYSVVSKKKACSLKNEYLAKALASISEGDQDKAAYTILGATLEILILDRNLSTYYTSTHINVDGISVNLDQADYTNVEGGLGIFASYLKMNVNILIAPDYVKSFGYTSLY